MLRVVGLYDGHCSVGQQLGGVSPVSREVHLKDDRYKIYSSIPIYLILISEIVSAISPRNIQSVLPDPA